MKILVTGNQRSGTSITARILAYNFNCPYIDEEVFHTRDIDSFEKELNKPGLAIVHCPSMAYMIHKYPSNLVVWVNRPFDEIKASQVRIGWGDKKERENYNARYDKRDIILIKNIDWQWQKDMLPFTMEINYHDLVDHPLFVKDRDDWETRQWKK